METSLLVISEISGLFGNTLTADQMQSRHRPETFPLQVQTLLSQKSKTFSGKFIACLQSRQNIGHFEKKDQLRSINILEVIDPDKCSYFNAQKFQVYKTLEESTCSGVTNTAETNTAALSSQFSRNVGEIEYDNISLSYI